MADVASDAAKHKCMRLPLVRLWRKLRLFTSRASTGGLPTDLSAYAATCAVQAAFLALAAGGPPQPRAPCPVPSPFFALLGKAGGSAPRPRALTPEVLETLGAADALLARGDAWAGAGLGLAGGLRAGGLRASADSPGLWQGGAGLGLGLGPEAPAADVLAGCASFQAAALARPGPFFGSGMPSTGSTESDGTFAGAAVGACNTAGFELQQVRCPEGLACVVAMVLCRW